MAEFKSDNILDRFDDNRSLDVPAQDLRGRYRIARAQKLAFDAAQDDTVLLVGLPGHTKLSAAISRLRYSAFGASVTCAIGFKDDAKLGITGKTAALLAATSVASAGSTNAMAAVAIGDENKELWELAGVAARTHDLIYIQATLGGANPASGSLVYEQGHITD